MGTVFILLCVFLYFLRTKHRLVPRLHASTLIHSEIWSCRCNWTGHVYIIAPLAKRWMGLSRNLGEPSVNECPSQLFSICCKKGDASLLGAFPSPLTFHVWLIWVVCRRWTHRHIQPLLRLNAYPTPVPLSWPASGKHSCLALWLALPKMATLLVLDKIVQAV